MESIAPVKRVLAFDIGIKNLAFCVLDQESATVLALENCTLIPPVQPIACSDCKVKASFEVNQLPYCKKHIPKTHTILPELSKKKLPPNKALKELVKIHQCENLGTSNEKCLHALSTRFAMPLQQPKTENASKMSLESIHDALRRFIRSHENVFRGCSHVLLENQPVFKNPHMKSVQVLLFATLRDWYQDYSQSPVPEFHLVHAKKKVEDAPKGDTGYAERKQKSEDRVTKLFEEKQLKGSVHYDNWKKAKKKSDMADAVCMVVDFI